MFVIIHAHLSWAASIADPAIEETVVRDLKEKAQVWFASFCEEEPAAILLGPKVTRTFGRWFFWSKPSITSTTTMSFSLIFNEEQTEAITNELAEERAKELMKLLGDVTQARHAQGEFALCIT